MPQISNKKIIFGAFAIVIIGVIIAVYYFLVFAPKPHVKEEKVVTPSATVPEEKFPEKVEALFQDSLNEALEDIEALEL